nr:zf-CCHC domain-containing protein/DUF4219 domain-containing protein/UBN2 domain-containing protein [Tanacetum cinerariifolium]
EKTIDSGFTRFNSIVTSLKYLNQDYSSKNHVRKFLHTLLLKWRAKVMAIKEAKDLATLLLDELIGNLKGNRFGCGNRFGNGGNRFERSHKNGFGNEGGESSRQRRGCYNCGEEGHFIGRCPKPKENKAFVGSAWSDSEDGPMYNTILKKKLLRKEGRGGNFVIPCSIMRLSLANHSYIYPLGIAKDVLVDVAGFVYPMDFIILDVKEDEHMPIILGTSFLTTARAEVEFDKGSMTLNASKYKIRFFRTVEFPSKIEERIGRDLDPMIPTNYVNKIILEWEERIKIYQENKMGFNKWRSKVFDDKNLAGHNLFVYELEEEDSNVNDVGVT